MFLQGHRGTIFPYKLLSDHLISKANQPLWIQVIRTCQELPGETNAIVVHVLPPHFSPQLLVLSMTPCDTGHPFGQSVSTVLVLSLPSSLCTPQPHAGSATQGRQMLLPLCKHCLATSQYWCAVASILNKIQNIALYKPLVRKLTQCQPKPRKASKQFSCTFDLLTFFYPSSFYPFTQAITQQKIELYAVLELNFN